MRQDHGSPGGRPHVCGQLNPDDPVIPGRQVRISSDRVAVPCAPGPAGRPRTPPGRPEPTTPAAFAGPPGPEAGDAPEVHFHEEDGVVTAIDVTCPCGRRIRLRCVY